MREHAGLPERHMRLCRFWFDELETSVDRMDLEAAREALKHLWDNMLLVSDFLHGGKS